MEGTVTGGLIKSVVREREIPREAWDRRSVSRALTYVHFVLRCKHFPKKGSGQKQAL